MSELTPHQHDELRDDLAGHALGSLDPATAARVEAHLATCADCRQVHAEYRAVLELLPLGLPATQPSAASRARLLAASQREPAATPTVSAGNRLSAWWSPSRLVAASFATALLLLIGLTVWQGRDASDDLDTAAMVEQIRNDPDAQVWPMTGSDAAPDATGNLFLEPGQPDAALIANDLPQPTDGHQYQFWFIRPDETRVSGGVFDVDRAGGAIVLLSAPTEFSDGWSCGVSEEPAGGSTHPTGRGILRADYDDSDYYTD